MFTKVAMIFGCAWFAGTTIMPHIYRAFGAKIGKRVTIRTLDLAECDLVEIGDDCVIEVCTQWLYTVAHDASGSYLILTSTEVCRSCRSEYGYVQLS